ncbi:MAG: preprotein translocase subunit YajC [Candidatus Eisenbacteria bacterium]
MFVVLNGLISIGSILGQCDQQQGGSSGLLGLWPIVLIFVIFYFLLIRPQQKKQKDHQKMLESVKKGDRVVTSGGVYGTVVGVKDNIIVLKIAEDVKIEFSKAAISAIVERE